MLLIKQKTDRIELQKKQKILFELYARVRIYLQDNPIFLLLLKAIGKQGGKRRIKSTGLLRTPFYTSTAANTLFHIGTTFIALRDSACRTMLHTVSAMVAKFCVDIGTPLLRSFTTFRKKRNNGKNA